MPAMNSFFEREDLDQTKTTVHTVCCKQNSSEQITCQKQILFLCLIIVSWFVLATMCLSIRPNEPDISLHVQMPDSSYPFPLYIPTHNFSIPLPNLIPNPIASASRRTIYSRIRNITLPAKAATPWPKYRLGDMFRISGERHAPNGWDLHHRRFKTSIATEYMRRIEKPFIGTEGDSNYQLMIQIINERIARNKTLQSMLPDNKTLVIHLRTGDVIDDHPDIPIREFLSINVKTKNHHGAIYTRGLPFYAEIWDQIQSEHIVIDRILVITGWHFNIRHFRSIAYINEVIKYLEQMVDRVDIRLNENPDEDVIIMSKSTFFVQCGGGFSEMISGLVQRNGGRVFGNPPVAGEFRP